MTVLVDFKLETESYRVLLVEPQPAIAKKLATELQSLDLLVFQTTTLAEALIAFEEAGTFDLLVVNQELPDGEGLSFVEGLRLPEQTESQMPVIMLAPDDAQLLERCFQLGIDDYLLQPVNPRLLGLKAKSLISKLRLASKVLCQKSEVERLLEASRREAEMASYVFYDNLLDQVSDTLRGFNRYLNASSDFCGDLILAKASPSGSIYILHADAMGHGLSATMTLLPLVDIFHGMVSKGYALPMIVREMNRKLHFKLPPDRFVAAVLVELDILHDQVSIWNGGMPPLYHLDDSGSVITSYPSKHLALGILDNQSFDAEVERIQLSNKGSLFGCSDGFVEQMNALGESYGVNRLLSSLSGASRHSLMSSLITELKEFSGLSQFDDDVSLFYVHFAELIYLQHQQHQKCIGKAHLQKVSPFCWQVTLTGHQIGDQEIPAMCNDFLQDMGFPQPFCQRAFTVISELTNNAIEHGLLDLQSSLKEGAQGFAEYCLQREQRLTALDPSDWLRVKLAWQGLEDEKSMTVEIEHNGVGFDASRVLAKHTEELSGRGLMLIRKLAANLEYGNQGRLAKTTLK